MKGVSHKVLYMFALLAAAIAVVWSAASHNILDVRAQANTWRSNGPLSTEEFLCLAIDPATPRTIYAGLAYRGIGDSGIFKSVDDGASWRATGFLKTSVYAIAIDPNRPNTIYAAVNDIFSGGVYKSIDGGASWEQTGRTSSTASLAIDPRQSNIIYAGTAFGVYKSTDSGATWNRPSSSFDLTIPALVLDPNNPNVIYVATHNSGVFKSSDGGKNWSKTGAIEPVDRGSSHPRLAIDSTNTNILYVTYGDIYKTTNGGATWSQISNNLTDPSASTVAIDPSNSSTVYVGTYASHGLIYKSTNGGVSWSGFNTGLQQKTVWDLVVDRSGSSLHAAIEYGGVYDYQYGAACTVGCSAVVPSTANTGAPVTFTASATIPGCGNVSSLTWRRSLVWRGDQSGPTDSAGRAWNNPAFDDAQWDVATFPDSKGDDGALPNDHYYRAHFNWDGSSQVKVNFSSDDGLAIYINGASLGSWGNGYRQVGCVNGPSICSLNTSIPTQTIPASLLHAGDNVIAIDVWNANEGFYLNIELASAPPLSAWRRSPIWRGDQSGPTDSAGRAWNSSAFDDAQWTIASLPDSVSGDSQLPNDRYYRARFIWDGSSQMKVNFSSDDGLTVYVNGSLLGSWGNGYRQAGCVNLSFCALNTSVPAQTIPASLLRTGENIIAIDVWNTGEGFSLNAGLTSEAPMLTYDWDFGDNTPHSSSAKAQHTYTASGSYTWKLTTSLAGADACIKTGSITLLGQEIIANVRARQLGDGTNRVEILYDLSGASLGGVTVSVAFSNNSGGTYDITPAVSSLSGAVGGGITNGSDRRILWGAVQTLPPETFGVNFLARLSASGSATYSNQFAVDLRSRSRLPVASFTFSPQSPTVGAMVSFTDDSSGSPASWEWDFDGDGTTDATTRNPTYTFTSAGPYRITLRVSNAYGSASLTQVVRVTAPGDFPTVTSVVRQYPGVFLEGHNLDLRLDAGIDWKGGPGKVSFSVNGGPPVDIAGNVAGASNTFKIGQDIRAGLRPTVVTITPTNGAGRLGTPWSELIYVFPFPSWLREAIARDPSSFLPPGVRAGEITYKMSVEFPSHHLGEKSQIRIPDWVPYLHGDFGMKETFFGIDGQVSSAGRGNLTLRGQTGFVAMQKMERGVETSQEIVGEGSGSGEFLLLPPNGLMLTGAAGKLKLEGTISAEEGIVTAIPALKAYENIPGVKQLNKLAKLRMELSPSLETTLRFAQDPVTGKLTFSETTATVGLDVKSILKADIVKDRINAEAWVAGGGRVELGVPEPYMRAVEFTAEAGAKIQVDFLFSFQTEATYQFSCDWAPGREVHCVAGDSPSNVSANASNFSERAGQADLAKSQAISLIQPNYAQFGERSVFEPNPKLKPTGSTFAGQTSEATLISNVFPGAAPTIVPTGTGKLLLWVQQDPARPILQSTSIAWSYGDSSGWSTPMLIADDTRVDLSPVAGVNNNGKVVAAWLRIKDSAFSTPINSLADLPLFYSKLEVVSAIFDPVSRVWGPITQLTDDFVLDTDLRLSADGTGHLLLTWLSNSGNEFTGTTSSPSVLKYSFWNGVSWGAPAAVASGLIGVSSHTAAIKGTKAFVIVPRDPNADAAGDEVLDTYSWNGTQWSTGSRFAAGGDGHYFPSAVYDAAGEGQVVWVRGSDLVHATLSNPTPEIIRPSSNSLGFYDAKLLINAQGNLTLIWQESASGGPANIFAVLYDPVSKTWSADRRLNEDAALARDFTGYYGDDGSLHAVYLSTQISRTSKTAVLGDQPHLIPNVPQIGRTDLRLLDHSLIVDLAVTDKGLKLIPSSPQTGDVVTTTLEVLNVGDFAVGSFGVNLYAGSPDGGGVVVGSTNVVGQLSAGSHRTVTFTFTYPASGGNIVAVVDPGNVINEFSKANNRATIYLANTAPQARVAANITNGVAPLTVDFEASASFDLEGDVLAFNWAFADGGLSAGGAKVSHTFNRAGIYPVTVAVIDIHGAVAIAVVTISVTAPKLVANVSAASYNSDILAAESIVAAFGASLATSLQVANSVPLPTTLAGTTVKVKDSVGVERLAPLFFVAPSQINYQIPPGTANGAAVVTVTSGDGAVSTGAVQIASVAPGLFSVNSSGQGLAAAVALRVRSDGSLSYEPITRFDSSQNKIVAVPIDLGPPSDQVFLILYGTGWRSRSNLSAVTVKIGGVDAETLYAGLADGFVGLDQLNARVPRSLVGRGEIGIALTVDGKVANIVSVNVR